MNTLVIVLIAACASLRRMSCMGAGWRKSGVLTQRQRHLRLCTMTGRIMCPQTDGLYLPISFPPSRGRDL